MQAAHRKVPRSVTAKLLAALLLLSGLSGCVGLAAAGAGAAGFGDGKTPIDHAVSWFEGKECSSTREVQGLTYCAEDEPQIVYTGHCYRTLGEVTCYTDPNPFPGQHAPVGGETTIAALPHQDLKPASKPLAPTPSNTN